MYCTGHYTSYKLSKKKNTCIIEYVEAAPFWVVVVYLSWVDPPFCPFLHFFPQCSTLLIITLFSFSFPEIPLQSIYLLPSSIQDPIFCSLYDKGPFPLFPLFFLPQKNTTSVRVELRFIRFSFSCICLHASSALFSGHWCVEFELSTLSNT